MSVIADLEKQIADLKAQLKEARKTNAPEPVKNYDFQTTSGNAQLSDLFGDKNELFIIHNMGKSCSYCTHWADVLSPIMNRITNVSAIALCTPDDLETAQKLASARGWNFPLINDIDRSFSTEMGYYKSYEEDGETKHSVWPGISAFRKNPDGSIVRLNHTEFGPGDDFCPTWPLLELIGDPEWQPS
jgi:predicted dithiol-disulfide oxidoreductase (DUF899 family)